MVPLSFKDIRDGTFGNIIFIRGGIGPFFVTTHRHPPRLPSSRPLSAHAVLPRRAAARLVCAPARALVNVRHDNGEEHVHAMGDMDAEGNGRPAERIKAQGETRM